MTSTGAFHKRVPRRCLAIALCCFFTMTVWAQKRGGDQRIYLEHSNELRHDEMKKPGVQIVKGNVAFRHAGTRLTCDSAYFNQNNNSFEAFGHVRMVQGDTLSMQSDYAFYDGRPMVEMVYARKNVVVVHRKTSILYTDSLNYDRKYNFVYFAEGGHLVDKKKKVDLVGDWGRYNLDTRDAVVYYGVVLKSPDYEIHTDTLYYDARLERAQIVSRSTIYSLKDNYQIVSSNGYYYMAGDKTELFDRSTIENQQRMITGDSIFYDSEKKKSRGVGNVVYVDKKNNNSLTAGSFVYDEKTGEGLATRNPVFMDYSQKDTLYLHADTMRVKTFYMDTDSMYREVYCYNKVRAYRIDVQAVCDSMVVCSKDSSLTMLRDPIVWNDERQLLGDKITVFMNDSTIREAWVEGNALSIELMFDDEHYNQVASKRMNAYFDEKGQLRLNEAIGNVQMVYYPVDDNDSSIIAMIYNETDTMRMYLSEKRKLKKIWMHASEGVVYPLTQVPPKRDRLPGFGWYDYVRPLNKDDIFIWRGKRRETMEGGGK